MLFKRPLSQALLLCVIGSTAVYAQAQSQPPKPKKTASAAKSAKTAVPAKRAVAAPPKPASRVRPATAAAAGAVGVAAVATAGASAKAAVPAPSAAEARLLHVIELVKRQELDAALRAAAQLTTDIPNFRAAQLVYADLLRFKTGRATGWAGAPAPEVMALLAKHTPLDQTALVPAQQQEQVQGLQKELQRRVKASSALPAAASVPREFQQLGASVRHAVAIDASKSRLYLFAHEKGQLRLVRDFYVSIGKLGMGKSLEGDQRTPQGVYFIGRQIPGARLPDFYGKGALTLNYPNDWDRSLNRSGDGIWLHGSPPDQFARLPEASDGCIVLANPDLIALMKTLDRQTPVLISDKLQWTGPADRAHAKAGDAFVRVLDGWQQAWKTADPRLLARLYGSAPAAERFPTVRLTEFFRLADIAVQDLSVYAWKEARGEIRIVEMQLASRKAGRALSLRQYWRRMGEHWQVLSEEIRG